MMNSRDRVLNKDRPPVPEEITAGFLKIPDISPVNEDVKGFERLYKGHMAVL